MSAQPFAPGATALTGRGLSSNVRGQGKIDLMDQNQLEQLSPRVQRAIREAAPVSVDQLEHWITKPIPALGNKSVVQVIAELGAEGELDVVALCNSIRGRF